MVTIETLRVFFGSTELNISTGTVEESSDSIVNIGKITIPPTTGLVTGSILDFRKADGITSVFSGQVEKIEKPSFWVVEVLSGAYELNGTPVQQVWEAKSPEFIVQDVVDNYTQGLTYVPGPASGIVIDYIGDGYAIDIIQDMMDMLQWQLRVDTNSNVYYEPKGNINNGFVFNESTNIQYTRWNENKESIFNHVKIKGGFEGHNKTETIAGTGLVFTLSEKPTGSMEVTGVDAGLYKVLAEEKRVTFDTSKTNPEFAYDWSQPIVIEDQSDSSIIKFEMTKSKNLDAPWANTFVEARKYAAEVLAANAFEKDEVTGDAPGFLFDVSVGEVVTNISASRDKNIDLVVQNKVYDLGGGVTTFQMNQRKFVYHDWLKGVQDRIKKLERRAITENNKIFARLKTDNLRINLTVEVAQTIKTPVDSFILNHFTLGRMRADLNFEADCSTNANYGTWIGTGIDGSQYNTSGYRLSCGVFNGSDHVVTMQSAETPDSIAFSINPTTINSKVIMYGNSSTDELRVSSGGFLEVYDGTAHTSGVSISTGSWQHVALVWDTDGYNIYVGAVFQEKLTTTKITIDRIGKPSTGMIGSFDELFMFSTSIGVSVISDIINKFLDDTHSDYSDVSVYYSFDNPKLGDRRATI
jgi:hypothetical protein